MTHITKNLEDLKRRIAAACRSAGRNENQVSILAVSKLHPIEFIGEAVAAGLTRFGENYAQEAAEKIDQLDAELEWHFIGRVQSNKTRLIAEKFDWVQTVASEKIARRLSNQRPEELGPLNVCVQVDTDGNSAHGGASTAELHSLCGTIQSLPGLKLRGLMNIPLPTANQTAQREPFRQLKQEYDQLLDLGYELDTLSMGMTNDLEAAIIEGSTMIRIGTAIFGPRPV